MNPNYIKILLFSISLSFLGCSSNQSSPDESERASEKDSIIEAVEQDVPTYIYSTVRIGTQEWMSENLQTQNFSNGDPIEQAVTLEDWEKASLDKQPAWCFYNNDPSNMGEYGILYNWYAVNDDRGLAPNGWKVASDSDWKTLNSNTDNHWSLFSKGWPSYPEATNSSGFSALPSGRRYSNGTFSGINELGVWWTSTPYHTGNEKAIAYGLPYGKLRMGRMNDSKLKGSGFSVRCIKVNP